MKHLFNILLAVGLVAFAACQSRHAGGWCTVSGTVGKAETARYEGCTVYLTTPSTDYVLLAADSAAGAKVMDSCRVAGGRFSFSLADTLPAQMAQLVLPASARDSFPSTLLVVLEGGRIAVLMGETVYTGGTSLNDRLQDFLIARSNLNDVALSGDSAAYTNHAKALSDLVLATIRQNRDNVLGAYLIKQYQKQ